MRATPLKKNDPLKVTLSERSGLDISDPHSRRELDELEVEFEELEAEELEAEELEAEELEAEELEADAQERPRRAPLKMSLSPQVPNARMSFQEALKRSGPSKTFASSAAPSTTALARRESTALAQPDVLTRYLAEIKRYPLLSREEEEALTERYFEEQDERAGKQLVVGNLRLVVKIAMEYRREWSNVMDLIQEGNLGLAQAVKRFDPYRGVRFGTFARYWIRALILQYILKNHHMISFANTRAGRKLFFRLEKERARLMREYGEASVKMLADNLEVSEEEVKAVMHVKRPTLSLDAPKQADDPEASPLVELVANPDEDLELELIERDLSELLDAQVKAFSQTLTDEREQVIWHERLQSDPPASLASLGERFEVSRERVRQLEQRLKERFKAFLREELGEEVLLDFERPEGV